jgi:hypothetical protein
MKTMAIVASWDWAVCAPDHVRHHVIVTVTAYSFSVPETSGERVKTGMIAVSQDLERI